MHLFYVFPQDPKLKIQVKGEDDIEVANLAAGILFEVSCFSQSFGISINTTMIIQVTSTSTNTTLELSKRETKVNERLTILELGNNDVEVAIFCKSYDSSGFLYGEEMTKRNVYGNNIIFCFHPFTSKSIVCFKNSNFRRFLNMKRYIKNSILF